jgi:putative acetyltransferase
MSLTPFSIRPIRAEDDPAVASIIRTVMPQFGASGAGFAINDPEVDHMSRAYSAPRHAYFVVEKDGKLVGGGGVGHLAGAAPEICELRKMYFLEEARGHGVGEKLLRQCLVGAKELGYATMYLETLNTMTAAQKLYEKLGFKKIDKPMGATGHFGCDRFYARPV